MTELEEIYNSLPLEYQEKILSYAHELHQEYEYWKDKKVAPRKLTKVKKSGKDLEYYAKKAIENDYLSGLDRPNIY